MKKNDVFTFTTPNGAEVTGVIVELLDSSVEEGSCDYYEYRTWLCYAQNRIFIYNEAYGSKYPGEPEETLWTRFNRTLVEYCILPEQNKILEDYYHQQDLANDYADKEI